MIQRPASVIETLAAMNAGSLTASQHIASLVGQLAIWRQLNAVVGHDEKALRDAATQRDRERASGRLRGPLHGVAFAAKDNVDTVDLPTTGCTPALLGNRPSRNAPVLQALLDAGALLFGKTSMHELAFGITNNHGAFGPARNPYDPTRIPGGSSGGSAAAVAAGIVPFALGSDTGGSVRLPAALCGIAGFRPTLGRYSQDGVIPISSTRDTLGPMARSVEDLALVDGIITGQLAPLEDVKLTGLRLGVPRQHFYEDLDADVATRMQAFLDALESAGATLVEESIADVQKLDDAVSFVLVNYEARRCLERYLARSAPGITFEDVASKIASPDVKPVYEAIANLDLVPESVYREALEVHRPALQRAFAGYFERHRLDAYVVPTSAMTARPIGQDQTVELNGRQVPTFLSFIRNVDPSSNAGIPSISIPVGLSSGGLPVGALFEAPAGSDRRLLAIARAAERVAGPTPPPVPKEA
jgi:Asp-tRNA(Asn)/Glu-tRNA(Gln) amidotransferase A subunit family amidase